MRRAGIRGRASTKGTNLLGHERRVEALSRAHAFDLARDGMAVAVQAAERGGRAASYLFRVFVDSTLVGESPVLGAGLRHDRPI